MTKCVITLLLVVVMMSCSVYGIAVTAFDGYKNDASSAENQIVKYEKQNEALLAYLDAAESGDQKKWEAARNTSAVSHALLMHSGESEIDAVKHEMQTNQYMIENGQYKLSIAQHKMDLYYHAYVLQDFDAINAILTNGNRTLPEDVPDNIYYTWPYTDVPDELLTNRNVFLANAGNVYLVPAVVAEDVGNSIYHVKINDSFAEVKFANNLVSIGETINIYFSPFVWDSGIGWIVVGAEEDELDSYHANRKYVKE